jgi:hypothetical protein
LNNPGASKTWNRSSKPTKNPLAGKVTSIVPKCNAFHGGGKLPKLVRRIDLHLDPPVRAGFDARLEFLHQFLVTSLIVGDDNFIVNVCAWAAGAIATIIAAVTNM